MWNVTVRENRMLPTARTAYIARVDVDCEACGVGATAKEAVGAALLKAERRTHNGQSAVQWALGLVVPELRGEAEALGESAIAGNLPDITVITE